MERITFTTALLLFTSFCTFAAPAVPPIQQQSAITTSSININAQLSIEFSVAKAKGDNLLLILPSEHGIQSAETELLKTLPLRGVEVWLSHLLESYFMENSASNLERIPVKDIQVLIQKLHRITNKNIVILSAGRGVVPILRALSSWPEKTLPSYVTGLILMHPKLFIKTPDPGLTATLLPSVNKTNQLIYLIQPKLSPFWWNRELVVDGLQQSGSDVFVRPLSGIRNRFYFRHDATNKEQQVGRHYKALIYNALKQLIAFPKKLRTSTNFSLSKTSVTSVKTERNLKTYKGNPIPPALKLPSLQNKMHDLKQYKGQVVLINFWASWCPPCVHEMPSMQQLEDHFITKTKSSKTSFKILAVNMAEDAKTIQTFLKTKIAVDFDILLDSDGAALKSWKVFAFPTSFIVGKKGQIRYAIYGSLDWMNPDVVQKIQYLINE